MFENWRLVALALPFLLGGCFIAPAKFTSTLDIRADRSFTFTYVGDVIALSDKSIGESLSPQNNGADESWGDDDADNDPEPTMLKIAAKGKSSGAKDTQESFDDSSEEAGKLQALAKALAQEYGYRSVRYIGNHTLAIDYAISGRLDRTFIFPFNVDGEVVVPFLAIELRGKDRLRIKAPAFANERMSSGAMGGLPGGGKAPGDSLDGTFTLTTGAEIVSQNQEDGATLLADGRRQMVWRATPALKDAPMAVLKVASLP